MRIISERISVDDTKSFSLVILGKTERWKESLLLFWVLAWTFSGSVFIYYYFADNPLQYSIPLLIMIAFWLYFELRITKVFYWRRKGFEHIQFKDKELSIRNSLLGMGKTKAYELNGIEGFFEIEYSSKNFFQFMEHSFWVIGGQRLYFNYFGKRVELGMQLNELEIKKTLSLLNGQLKISKKKLRANQRNSEDKE